MCTGLGKMVEETKFKAHVKVNIKLCSYRSKGLKWANYSLIQGEESYKNGWKGAYETSNVKKSFFWSNYDRISLEEIASEEISKR